MPKRPVLNYSAGLRFLSLTWHRDLAIRGTEDQGGGVDYDLDETEQDVSDHFPLLAVFDTGGMPTPVAGGPMPMGLAAPAGAPPTVLQRIERLQNAVKHMQQELEQLKREIQGSN